MSPPYPEAARGRTLKIKVPAGVEGVMKLVLRGDATGTRVKSILQRVRQAFE